MVFLCLLAVLAVGVFGQTWQIQKADLATILMGVSFPTTTEGFISGDANGVGAIILRTDDGGNTYSRCNHSDYAILYMGIAFGSTTNGVVSGAGIGTNFPGVEETTDGHNFVATDTANYIDECQNVETVKGVDGGFGLPGDWNQVNGLTITLDGGKTWNNYDIGVDYWSRYGSFPSATTWYISAGWWPEYDFHNEENPNITVISSKIRLNHGVGVEYAHNFPRSSFASRHLLQTSYAAAVMKTTDGGKTWTKVYEDLGNFYPNAIDCPSENNCWVVCESDADSANPGIRILHTGDGGQTWEVQYFNSDSDYSLLDVSFLNDTEGWAAGGILNDRDFEGQWYHTTDAGKTWVPQEVKNVYGNSLSFAWNEDKTYVGWSTAFTKAGQSSTLIYK